MRTPLHTRPEQIETYGRIAFELLDSLRTDVSNLLLSNDDEHHAEGLNAEVQRNEQLAIRMDTESWVDQTTQQLRDVMYLLAVGDNGPTAVSMADLDGGATKQAHDQRRRAAIDRLTEDGLL